MKIKTIGLGVPAFSRGSRNLFREQPNVGTWKTNESNPLSATAPVNARWWCWKKVADQQMHVDGTDVDGRKTHSEWTGKMDGKSMRSPGAGADQRSFKKSDDNTIAMCSEDGRLL